MKLIFFGDDQHSAIVLSGLLQNMSKTGSHELLAVITTRPKPKGRDGKISPSAIEDLANTHNQQISYYPSNNDEMSNFIYSLKTLSPDLGILASFGHILPGALIAVFPQGIINVHPSLLPQYRGATPVQHALALGDELTGVTLFTLTEGGIDDGKILAQKEEKILPEDTTPTLSARLFNKGTELLLNLLANSTHHPPPTINDLPPTNIIFTRTFTRDSGFVEWEIFLKLIRGEPVPPQATTNHLLTLRLTKEQNQPTSNNKYQAVINDLLRSLSPWPGVWTIAPLKSGVKRLKLTSVNPPTVHLEGKPRPVSWDNFRKSYSIHA